MIRTNDITSFTDYRQHLRQHHSYIRETGRPFYVTNKGEVEAVVLSPEAFNALADRAELPEILAMIARSESDLKAGCASDALKTLRKLAEQNDLKLDS
jgi:PHD/YefM family antitoxin component YafN of YafNO toxin-antitoxin module